jgi:hypothetical protein
MGIIISSIFFLLVGRDRAGRAMLEKKLLTGDDTN